jgi:septal ring factor EnvC (AmiA/AmiB activator)
MLARFRAVCCVNPMSDARQAALEAQVEDLNSKLEKALKSCDSLNEQLLDAVTKHSTLEQTMTKVQAENEDMRRAGISFRATAAWKVKNLGSVNQKAVTFGSLAESLPVPRRSSAPARSANRVDVAHIVA